MARAARASSPVPCSSVTGLSGQFSLLLERGFVGLDAQPIATEAICSLQSLIDGVNQEAADQDEKEGDWGEVSPQRRGLWHTLFSHYQTLRI